MSDELIAPVHRPTGSWWTRVREAFRIAVENVTLRRLEGLDADDWYEHVDRLQAKQDRKGGD